MQTPTPPRYVRRDDPLLFALYRITPRQVRRAQSEGRLSTIRPSGRSNGPAYVDRREVRALYADSREEATSGPLASQGDSLDALIRRATEDRDPEATRALVAMWERIEFALCGEQ